MSKNSVKVVKNILEASLEMQITCAFLFGSSKIRNFITGSAFLLSLGEADGKVKSACEFNVW